MKKLLVLGIFVIAMSFTTHKFYVSNTLIEFNAQSQSYEVTCKLFTDDLERALGGDAIHLGAENEASNANTLVEEYVRSHFKITFNDQPQLLSFVGKEVENDLTLCYFEMYQATDFNVLKVDNTMLLELFPEQKNIVELTSGGRSQTYILTKDKTAETIFH